MWSCSGLPGGTPTDTGNPNSDTWGMAIYQPSSKLFVTTAGSAQILVCDQNNGVVSGCVDVGVPVQLLSFVVDIVFFGGSAIIADQYVGLITCKVEVSDVRFSRKHSSSRALAH